MGDVIEITTYARHPTSFYRVSAGAFTFKVKALNAAVVGLAKEPGNTCLYWFGFGQGGKIWIKGPEGLKTSQGGTYSLSINQFKSFWIAWDCSTLRVGQGHENLHIISYPYNNVGLNYVTFSLHDQRQPAIWKFELPPPPLIKLSNDIISHKEILGGELKWVRGQDMLPDDAVIGGFQAECLYIIRAHHAGSLTPGKFVPSEGVAYVSWGGAANACPDFEVLCGFNYTWEPTHDDIIPINAYVAGFSEVNNEKLYIGRVNHKTFVIPGKVQLSHKVCYVAYDDAELPFKNYEILTIPGLNPYAARVFMETYAHTNVLRNVLRNPVPNANALPNVVNENALGNLVNENAFGNEVNEMNDDADDDGSEEEEEQQYPREWVY